MCSNVVLFPMPLIVIPLQDVNTLMELVVIMIVEKQRLQIPVYLHVLSQIIFVDIHAHNTMDNKYYAKIWLDVNMMLKFVLLS